MEIVMYFPTTVRRNLLAALATVLLGWMAIGCVTADSSYGESVEMTQLPLKHYGAELNTEKLIAEQ